MRARRPRSLGSPLLALLAACGGAPAGPPDVLFLSVDTVRADRLSCYGYERPTTPELDRLAAAGVRFAHALSPSSQTAPSHMSIFSGLDPIAHGLRNVVASDQHSARVHDDVPLLPETFLAAGYRTCAIGDTGNVHPVMGFGRGFEQQSFRMQDLAAKLPEFADLCETESRTRPLFLFFHTYQVHSPYLPPEGWFGRFADVDYQGPFRQRYDQLIGRPLGQAFAAAGSFLDPFDGLGEEDVRWLSDLYDENLAWTDAGLGELLRLWAEHRGDDTLVVVFSDHGEEFYEHGGFGHRRGLYRELVHVPLLFRGRGVGRGVVEATVSLTGLAATVAELAGLDPSPFREPSFAAAVRDPESFVEQRPAFQQLSIGKRAGNFEAVARGSLQLIRTTAQGSTTLELFDAESDPGQRRDLSEREPAARAELEPLLNQRREQGFDLHRQHPIQRGPSLDAQRRKELEALGYVDGGGD
jgi:arylsulfatase A-like enzyme